MMKNKILKIGDKLFTPTCLVLICYFLYREELIVLPYINLVRLILIALPVFLCICAISDPNNKIRIEKLPNDLLKSRNIVGILYFYSEDIINYLFYFYFFFYMVLELDKKALTYNYVLLLIFGLFVGCRICKEKGAMYDYRRRADHKKSLRRKQ